MIMNSSSNSVTATAPALCKSRPLCCTDQLLLPDLVLQEAHVAVEQCVGRRQDPYRLHPRPPLHRALHRHVCKAGEAEVAALPEVAVDGRERDG